MIEPETLAGKTAIVTGGGGAIGAAVARRLGGAGVNVVLAGREPATLQPVAAELTSALTVQADVSVKADVQRLMAACADRFGGLDILVNVAGITSFGSFADLPEEEWDRVIDINLKSVFLCCQAAIPLLRKAGWGRIVNTGSLLGKNGGNARPWIDRNEQKRSGNAVYAASKAGINALTVYLARELAADNITVNAVAPGPIASAMTTEFPESLRRLIPVGRMGRPEDVSEAVAYLVGPNSGFVTGEIIDINGGIWGD